MTELVSLPGGRFRMGSDRHYPEEAPVREVELSAFRIERHPVTNARFAAFVADTGHVTTAEQHPDPRLYPGADPVVVLGGHSQSPGELGQHRIQLRHGRYCARPASMPQPSPRVPAGPARLGG